MEPTTITRRGTKAVECRDCHQGGLEWVYTDAGWRYVPVGTNDLSGEVHPLLPCGKVTAKTIDCPHCGKPITL